MPANRRASSPRYDRELTRLRSHLEKYRTGKLDAPRLAKFLLDLNTKNQGDLPWEFKNLLDSTAAKLEKGGYRVRSGKLVGNLAHLEWIMSQSWGKVRPRRLLGFGLITAGECPEFDEALDELGLLIEEVCPPPKANDLTIALIFCIPGSNWAPEFQGVRTSSFFASERSKQIQVAVPTGLGFTEMRAWLADTLIEVGDLVKKRVSRKYAPLSTEAAERALSQIASRMNSPLNFIA